MKDNEIIEALECCAKCNNAFVCTESKCPLFKQNCIDILTKNALDLINRQQAEIEALIAGQETMSKYIESQQAEIEKQSHNFKMLVSDHRCLQQSFDNLTGLYKTEKKKVENAKGKAIYFAKKLQEARAETNRMTAIAAEWKDAAYNIDKIKSEEIKRLAKKIRQKIFVMVCSTDLLTLDDYDNCIDDVLKEMVGEE